MSSSAPTSSERHFHHSVLPAPTYISQLRQAQEHLTRHYPSSGDTVVYAIIQSEVEKGVAQIVALNRLNTCVPIWIRYPYTNKDNVWMSLWDGEQFSSVKALLRHIRQHLWRRTRRLLPYAAMTTGCWSRVAPLDAPIVNAVSEIELQAIQTPCHTMCGFDTSIRTAEDADTKASQLPSLKFHLLWYDREHGKVHWRTAARTAELQCHAHGYAAPGTLPCLTRVTFNLRVYQVFSTVPYHPDQQQQQQRPGTAPQAAFPHVSNTPLLPRSEPSVVPAQAIIDSLFRLTQTPLQLASPAPPTSSSRKIGVSATTVSAAPTLWKASLAKFRVQSLQATGCYTIFVLLLPEDVVYILETCLERENQLWYLMRGALRQRLQPNGPSLPLTLMHSTEQPRLFSYVQELIQFYCAPHLSMAQILPC